MYGELEFVIGEPPVKANDMTSFVEMNDKIVNNEDSPKLGQDESEEEVDLGLLALSDPEAYEDYISGTENG